jgi:hypothetical protein
MKAGCRKEGSGSPPLLPTGQAREKDASRAEETTTSEPWLWRSMCSGKASMPVTPVSSQFGRASAPKIKVRWRIILPLERESEGDNEITTARKISVHITNRIWHGVEGVHFPRERGTTWDGADYIPRNYYWASSLGIRAREEERLLSGFLRLFISRRAD